MNPPVCRVCSCPGRANDEIVITLKEPVKVVTVRLEVCTRRRLVLTFACLRPRWCTALFVRTRLGSQPTAAAAHVLTMPVCWRAHMHCQHIIIVITGTRRQVRTWKRCDCCAARIYGIVVMAREASSGAWKQCGEPLGNAQERAEMNARKDIRNRSVPAGGSRPPCTSGGLVVQ